MIFLAMFALASAGCGGDDTPAMDAAVGVDAGGADAGVEVDAGATTDAAMGDDAGVTTDAAMGVDAGGALDAGDAGGALDAGDAVADGGSTNDAGSTPTCAAGSSIPDRIAGVCDGRGRMSCAMWATMTGGAGASAQCVPPDGRCARADSCAAGGACTCGGAPECADDQVCVASPAGGAYRCVCITPA